MANDSQGEGTSVKGDGELPDHPSCSQNAHGEREGMEPDDLLCSRNARPQKALVGRAQWKINQPPSLKRKRASLEGSPVTSLDGRSGTNNGAILKERASELGRII